MIEKDISSIDTRTIELVEMFRRLINIFEKNTEVLEGISDDLQDLKNK